MKARRASGSGDPRPALCCPDKFRGSLTAAEAAAAMAAGLRDAGVESTELPLADGGEGTLDVLLGVLGGERRTARVAGPLGGPVTAAWGVLPDGTAVVEAAQAAGLALVGDRNDPVRATTQGVGELLRVAAENGLTRAVVCVGGSATTDGGLGAVEALDWSLHGLEVEVACDVATRFADAARVFGPQKGASPAEVDELTVRLERLADRYRERTGRTVAPLPGSGAAGGLAGGLAALGASLRRGFDVVAEAVGLPDRLRQTGLVLTGEGRIDRTSFAGKVVGGVLALPHDGARRAAVAGEVAPEAVELASPDVELYSLVERAPTVDEAVERAAELVTEIAAEVGARARP